VNFVFFVVNIILVRFMLHRHPTYSNIIVTTVTPVNLTTTKSTKDTKKINIIMFLCGLRVLCGEYCFGAVPSSPAPYKFKYQRNGGNSREFNYHKELKGPTIMAYRVAGITAPESLKFLFSWCPL